MNSSFIVGASFVVTFIQLLLQALSFAILGRVLLSWIDPRGNMRVTQILHEMTEPILAPIRSVMPTVGMFDFSPIIAMLLLQVIGTALLQALQ
jgi:YggT family protein